jgi:hypothetical protein
LPKKLVIMRTLLLSYHDVITTDFSSFILSSEELLPLFLKSFSLGRGQFLDLFTFKVPSAQIPLLDKY